MMNSRQRVLAAIDHRQPDRVPIDLGGTSSSGISAIAYNRLIRHLGLGGGPAKVYDVVQQLAQPDDAVLDYFGVDAIDVGRAFNRTPQSWHPATVPGGEEILLPAWFMPHVVVDGSWEVLTPDGTRIAVMPAKGHFFDQSCFPYVNGCVFNTVHNILPEVPPENIVAMFEALAEYNAHA